MRKNKIYLFLIIIFLSSCYQKPTNRVINPGDILEPPAKDCTNLMTRMKILYGENQTYEGMDFARIIAVDKLDGTMSVVILPPEGSSSFPLEEELEEEYTLRFIACQENTQSIIGGNSFNGACKYSAPVNLIGGVDNVTYEIHLKEDGFKALIPGCEGGSDCWTEVHNTRDPFLNAGLALPTTIMFVASNNSNQGNDIIIAIGDSPYRACYYSNIR